MLTWIRSQQPRSLLDVGAGCGTYAEPWKDISNRPYLIGIEIWRPYLRQFSLHELYDLVLNVDVRDLTLRQWPRVDVVVLGDVLEHMTEVDAVRVWNLARTVARKAVYLSIPIVRSPQGAVHGNPHETHVVEDWSHERVLTSFPGITWQWKGSIVGRYEAEVDKS